VRERKSKKDKHHLQHHLFKPCEDSSRYSQTSTHFIDQTRSSQFQLINDVYGQPVIGGGVIPVIYNNNNSSSYQNEESKSMMTNGTVVSSSTRRNVHNGLQIMPTMPPISSRPGKSQGGRSTKN
jgi:hypothetical protein